ncbi:MAG: LuxR C-terminal-related transcriptional regulator [Saprospiraceae bacterium]|nr:LuxR C-terminal-related transcriptional regulator [Saprospiraceae bacterium]
MRRTVLYYIFSILIVQVAAQELPNRGVPYLDNYMPGEYNNSGKIWDIESNNENILFLASDKGLLEFDGEVWKRYKGSKGSTRSLLVMNDSILYSGSDLDFGRWHRNELLEYEYTSLYPFKDDGGRITEEFWDLYQMRDYIIFVSFNNIYVYKNEQLTKISAPYRFGGCYNVDGLIYIVDEKFGIYSFDGVSLNLEVPFPEQSPIVVRGISKMNDEILVISQNHGLFTLSNGILEEWTEALSSLLIRDQAFSFTTIDSTYFVFGTILNGIYITDKNGNILQHINKQRGLPNSTILDVHSSPNGMLWVSMDLGVSGIHLLQNVSYVFDHAGEFGTGQTALVKDDVFYLGTNQGLYKSSWKELKNDEKGISFTLLPGSTGQVWVLAQESQDLICGHDKGLFEVTRQGLKVINENIGVLDLISVADDSMIAGTYNGLHLYRKDGGSWTFIRELRLIKGACNQLLLDAKKHLWVHIPNYGVIKVQLGVDFNVEERIIYPIEGFQGELLYMENFSEEVYVVTDQYKYRYNSVKDEMEQVSRFDEIKTVKHRLPGNHLSQTLNDTFQFHPIYNGFAIKQTKNLHPKIASEIILLREFGVFNRDTSIVFPFSEDIPFVYNNLKVDCRIPHRENVMYRYFLDGYMDKWSDWSSKSAFELLSVREGEYTLQVEGKYGDDIVSMLHIPIKVLAPWYRSLYAYLVYLLLLFLIFFAIYRLQSFKLEQQKQVLLKKEKESLRMQAEAFKKEALVKRREELEKEKAELEKELKSTRIQLVIKAKEDEDKNRVIQSLNEKLRQMQGSELGNRMKWKELYRIIDGHQEKENSTFQIHMDELNQEFTQRLKSTFSSLTMYDVRLCTYIKTGLSTREIAEMMNVLPSSINVSRSRLRKKLKLDAKDDLYTFLDSL